MENKNTNHLYDKSELFNDFEDIIHEIRTKVHGISGVTRNLAESWGKYNEVDKFDYTQKVANATDDLFHLLNTVLDWSKISSGMQDFDFSIQHDFNSVIKEVINECSTYQLRGKNIKINFIETKQIDAFIDKDRIKQAILNLLTNAIKFSPENGDIDIALNVTKKQSSKESFIKFSITDYGVGIPKEDLESVFNRFVQSKSGKKDFGSGLGLAICKKIIQRHNGELSVINNANQVGVTFYFTIPISIQN